MSKELTTVEAMAEAEMVAFKAEMEKDVQGILEDVDSSDIVMAKIITMQPQNPMVLDEKAKFGDFVHNQTEAVVGNIKDGITITPIYKAKVWAVKKLEGDEFVYSHTEQFTPLNANLPWEDTLNGTPIKRNIVYKYYVFLGDDTSMPMIMDFKGASAQTGKQLYTSAWVTGARAGFMPYGKQYIVSGSKEKKDNRTYVVLKVAEKCNTPMPILVEGKKWYKTLKAAEANKNIKEVPEAQPTANTQF